MDPIRPVSPALARFQEREREAKRAPKPEGKRFVSVFFKCCHAYGRMYRTSDGTRYEGRCPGCGARVEAAIGPDGTDRRMLIAE